MRHLRVFSSSQTKALRYVGRELYTKESSAAKRKVAIGAGLFLGFAAMTAMTWHAGSADDEWSMSVVPGVNLSFSAGLAVVSSIFTGYSAQTARNAEAKQKSVSEREFFTWRSPSFPTSGQRVC